MAYGLSLSIISRVNGARRITTHALTNDCTLQRHQVYDVLAAKAPELTELFDIAERGAGVEIPVTVFEMIEVDTTANIANGIGVDPTPAHLLDEAKDIIFGIISATGHKPELFIEAC